MRREGGVCLCSEISPPKKKLHFKSKVLFCNLNLFTFVQVNSPHVLLAFQEILLTMKQRETNRTKHILTYIQYKQTLNVCDIPATSNVTSANSSNTAILKVKPWNHNALSPLITVTIHVHPTLTNIKYEIQSKLEKWSGNMWSGYVLVLILRWSIRES